MVCSQVVCKEHFFFLVVKSVVMFIFESKNFPYNFKTCVKILQNSYSQATAKIHLDKLVFDDFQRNRKDSLSPTLFTTIMEEMFKKSDISE